VGVVTAKGRRARREEVGRWREAGVEAREVQVRSAAART